MTFLNDSFQRAMSFVNSWTSSASGSPQDTAGTDACTERCSSEVSTDSSTTGPATPDCKSSPSSAPTSSIERKPYPGEIHYSDLMTWRECPAKFDYKMSGRYKGSRSPYMILGTLFHMAVEDCCKNSCSRAWEADARTARYWVELYKLAVYERPGETYELKDGTVVDEAVVHGWARLFAGDLFIKPLGTIVAETYKYLTLMCGYEVLHTELRLHHTDRLGREHSGTIDMVLMDRNGNKVIADVKTSGMWGKLLENKSFVKQSMTIEQVSHHPQLKHYHWLGHAAGVFKTLDEVKGYAIITPANLIPYTTGKNKGKARDVPLFPGTATASAAGRYGEDLFRWLSLIEQGWNVRTYPGLYGKLSCPTCPYKDECLNDQGTSEVPEWLR